MPRVAVLCGTGMEELSNLLSSNENTNERLFIETIWGAVPLMVIESTKGEVFVIDRHHGDEFGRRPPHMIDHRANVHAVSSTKPDLVISINSVGSINPNFPPGTIGVANDIIDLSVRPWTFFDNDIIHSDRTTSFWPTAKDFCDKVLTDLQDKYTPGVIVAQCIGPQFETPAEIDALEKLGADVVGMTLGPESRLISEMGLKHISICCSSNWASGRDPNDRSALINHNDVEAHAAEICTKVAVCISSILSWLGEFPIR